MKACDDAWSFLFDVMEATEFRQMLTYWIKLCVTTPRLSAVIIGELEEWFFRGRKIPYLFLLVMEGFYPILIRKLSRSFSYHPECRTWKLSSLAFADDLFLVCGVDVHYFGLLRLLWKI